MKFAKQVIKLIGCLVLGIFLSCASSVEQNTSQIKKTLRYRILIKLRKLPKPVLYRLGVLTGKDHHPSGVDFSSDII